MVRSRKKEILESEGTTELSEIEVLRKQVEMLTKQIRLLTTEKNTTDLIENQEIPLHALIKVMSLVPENLNLSTQSKGRGKTFVFTRMFEVKKIPYSDLMSIMENHANFLQQGKFYIMNRAVIEQHGLDDVYKSILTREKIEAILKNDNTTDVVNIFKSANKSQQESIVNYIKDIVLAGEELDIGLMDRLSRAYGKDIYEEIKNVRKSLNIK